MKKYRFSMGSVLRVRKITEEQQRAAHLAAQAEAERASAELGKRLHAIGAASPQVGQHTNDEFQEVREQLDRHHLAVLAARSAEANALEVAMTTYDEWMVAAREVKALERLDDRQHSEWTLEATRAAQAATDEIATTRFKLDGR
jgi:flagellar export protein FliJ